MNDTSSQYWAESSFDPKAAFSYSYIASLSEHGCKWAAQDKDGAFVALEVLSVDGKLSTGNLPKHAVGRVAWTPARFTLVPSAFYRHEERSAWLDFHTSPSRTTPVYAEEIPALRTYLVYTLSEEQEAQRKQSFQSWKTGCVYSGLLEQWALLERFANRQTCYVYFERGSMAVSCFDQGNLLFFNRFEIQAPPDVAYYILFALDQLRWDPHTLLLNYCFDVYSPDIEVELLRQYILKVSALETPANLAFGSALQVLPQGQYIALLSQALCA